MTWIDWIDEVYDVGDVFDTSTAAAEILKRHPRAANTMKGAITRVSRAVERAEAYGLFERVAPARPPKPSIWRRLH